VTARAVLDQYRRCLPFLRPYRGRMAAIISINLLATLFGLCQPYLSKFLIDSALLRRDSRMLWWAAGFMLIAAVLGFAFTITSSFWYVRVSAQALFDMRLAVYSHLQRLSPRYFARHKLGDIVSRVNNDIGEVQRILTDTILSIASNLLFLVGSIVAMLLLSPRLFIVGILLVPLSLFAMRHFQHRLARHVKLLRERSSDIGSFLIETILGIRLVVSSGTESQEIGRFRRLNSGFVDALLGMQLTSFLAGALPGTILVAASAIVFLYGGHMVIAQTLTVGSLVAFMAYHARLLSPVQVMMGTWSSILTGAVSLQRVYEVLDAPIEVQEAVHARVLAAPAGEVVFRNVQFRHVPETPLLEATSFRIPPGSICAIVGSSGAGKSTIVDLLLRFYDPQGGAIEIDGVDIRTVTFASLRQQVALVDQTPMLFAASIAENIQYGRPNATQPEIEAAAREAAIHTFVAGLPRGYETVISERGTTLSAGQRQRIAIARALLRKPRVLVLDEPTAALDPQAEHEIAETLSQALHHQTTTSILVTHRRSLVERADWVLVLENGKVVESGAPSDLLSYGTRLSHHFLGTPAPVSTR